MILEFLTFRVEGLPDGVDSIVATADLQGRDRPGGCLLGQWVAEELEAMAELRIIPPPSAILLAGDFFDHLECSKRGSSGEVGPVWCAFADRFPEVVGVHGNHDILEAVPEGTAVLDGQVEEVAGLRIGGICGIMGRTTKPQRRDRTEYLSLYEKILDQDPQIILSHCGPDDPISGRIGEPDVRELLERAGNSLVIFGHSHWQEPIAEFGGNQVLCVDARVAILTR